MIATRGFSSGDCTPATRQGRSANADRPGRVGPLASMTRYIFSIRTASGQRIERIALLAVSLADAERRLRQMYQRCEVVACRQSAVPRRIDTRLAQELVAPKTRTATVAPAVDVVAPGVADAANEAPKVLRLRRGPKSG